MYSSIKLNHYVIESSEKPWFRWIKLHHYLAESSLKKHVAEDHVQSMVRRCTTVFILFSAFTVTITITIYFINPSGKLKLSFDRTTKNYLKSWTTCTCTLLYIRPLSLNLLSYSKPKITWNNAFSVSNQNIKTFYQCHSSISITNLNVDHHASCLPSFYSVDNI